MRISDWSADVCSSYLIVAKVGNKVELRQPVAPAEPRFGIRIGAPQRDRLRHRERGRVARHPRNGFVTLKQSATPAWRNSQYPADRTRVVQGKRESVSVDLGGRSIIKKTKTQKR